MGKRIEPHESHFESSLLTPKGYWLLQMEIKRL
jgi:hypothetical protein